MALKSTVFKAQLTIADLDRGYYADHALTVARHPSETDERLMVRLLAFVLSADPALEFGRGLSTAEEPALWLRDPTGAIQLWIEVGLPDVKALRRAAGRSARVLVYAYGGRAVSVWWRQNEAELARIPRLEVREVPGVASAELEQLAERNLELTCTLQEGTLHLATADRVLAIELTLLKPAAA